MMKKLRELIFKLYISIYVYIYVTLCERYYVQNFIKLYSITMIVLNFSFCISP